MKILLKEKGGGIRDDSTGGEKKENKRGGEKRENAFFPPTRMGKGKERKGRNDCRAVFPIERGMEVCGEKKEKRGKRLLQSSSNTGGERKKSKEKKGRAFYSIQC